MSYWARGGDLSQGKQGTAAITLQTGQVLLVGGFVVPGSFSTGRCELSTTDGSSWSITGTLPYVTSFARLVLLSDGTVLSIGGSSDNGETASQANVARYDPGTGLWTAKTPMNHPRYGHGVWLLSNGKVLVAGGKDSVLGSVTATSELYDPVADTWTATGSFNFARFYGGDNLSGSNKPVYIAGAVNNSTPISSIEVYNVGAGIWTLSSASLPAGFGTNSPLGTCSITLNDGTILWVGCDIAAAIDSGGTIASKHTGVFDADADTFTVKGDLAQPTASNALFKLSNGTVMVAGGFDGLDADPTTSKVQIYNPSDGLWTDSISLPLAQIPEAFKSPVLLNATQPFVLGADSELGNLPNTYIFKDGSPPPMSITRVNTAGSNNNGVPNNNHYTFPSTTAGNTIIICVTSVTVGASQSITSVTDDGGNTYTQLSSVTSSQTGDGAIVETEIWYCNGIVGGAGTLTMVVTYAVTPTNTCVACLEYSGIKVGTPVDAANGGNTTSPSVSISNANDLLLAIVSQTNTDYPNNVAAPWTGLNIFSGPLPIAELIAPGSTGTQTAVFTGSSGAGTASSIAAFLPVPSGPSAKQKASTFQVF